jgi:hypothetical protein
MYMDPWHRLCSTSGWVHKPDPIEMHNRLPFMLHIPTPSALLLLHTPLSLTWTPSTPRATMMPICWARSGMALQSQGAGRDVMRHACEVVSTEHADQRRQRSSRQRKYAWQPMIPICRPGTRCRKYHQPNYCSSQHPPKTPALIIMHSYADHHPLPHHSLNIMSQTTVPSSSPHLAHHRTLWRKTADTIMPIMIMPVMPIMTIPHVTHHSHQLMDCKPPPTTGGS